METKATNATIKLKEEELQELEAFRVEYDDLVNQIHLLSKELDKAQIKAENLEIELEELRMLYDESSNPHHKDGR